MKPEIRESAIKELDAIREELREAHRYVRTEMQLNSGRIDGICERIRRLGSQIDNDLKDCQRIARNLFRGDCFVRVTPQMMEGYIYGAEFELGVIASSLRKESE